jgi:hypothetical protein
MGYTHLGIIYLFPFPLATAKLIEDVLTFFDQLSPLPSASHAPIGKADQIFEMNTRKIKTLRIFLGFTWHHLFKKSIRCANILAEL